MVRCGVWSAIDYEPPEHLTVGLTAKFKVKLKPDGKLDKLKARVVAQGFSQCPETIGDDGKRASVLTDSALHLILAHAAATGADLITADVSNAFLHAKLNARVFARVPPQLCLALGLPKYLQLHKSIYGLVQSAALWQAHLDKPLKGVLPRKNSYDECLYSRTAGATVDMLGTHVDDMLGVDCSGTLLHDLQKAMGDAKLPCTFEKNPTSFRGATIQRSEKGIYISQEKAIRDLADFVNANGKHTTPFYPVKNEEERCELYGPRRDDEEELPDKSWYRSAIGQLGWICQHSRPDVAYAYSIAAQAQSSPCQRHAVFVRHVASYLLNTVDVKLLFPAGQHDGHLDGSSDAGSVDVRTKPSYGFCLFWGNSLIIARSHCIRTVVHSTTEAELIALNHLAREARLIRDMIEDSGLPRPSICLETDNSAVYANVLNGNFRAQLKYVDRRYRAVAEYVKNKEIILAATKTGDMTADIFTKPLDAKLHAKHSDALGLVKTSF